jgi:hypothetical protein
VKKWISAIVSGVLGVGLAAVAAWGVVSSNTAAPDQNPAGNPANQVVDYGQK